MACRTVEPSCSSTTHNYGLIYQHSSSALKPKNPHASGFTHKFFAVEKLLAKICESIDNGRRGCKWYVAAKTPVRKFQ